MHLSKTEFLVVNLQLLQQKQRAVSHVSEAAAYLLVNHLKSFVAVERKPKGSL